MQEKAQLAYKMDSYKGLLATAAICSSTRAMSPGSQFSLPALFRRVQLHPKTKMTSHQTLGTKLLEAVHFARVVPKSVPTHLDP